MNVLCLCSGISAVSVATEELGWETIAFAEIEKFPSAVLAQRWPDKPNLGDITKFREWPEELLALVDMVAGGTPCQAFSLAGQRASLSDERGNLTLIYAHLISHIDQIRARHGRPPVVCLWENVPGVLNTDDNAFGCFLAALAGEIVPLAPPGGRWTDAGYVRGPERAIAWRLIDAQYFGVAQRRERVFALAGAGAFRPEEILFESEGVRRDSPPSRETGERVAGTLAQGSLGSGSACGGDGREAFLEIAPMAIQAGAMKENPNIGPDGVGIRTDGLAYTLEARPEVQAVAALGLIPAITGPLLANGKAAGSATMQDAQMGMLIPQVVPAVTSKWAKGSGGPSGDECQNLIATSFGEIARTLSARHDGIPCADRGPDIIAVSFAENSRHELRLEGGDGERTGCLSTGGGMPGQGVPMIAFAQNQLGEVRTSEVMGTLNTNSNASGRSTPMVASPSLGVRRLTPRECERLQAFPDDFTLIPYRGKPIEGCPDGPRYKALGNSWAVCCPRWICRRIHAWFLRN
ncbi:DNA cytosine methyltransferase [Luteolibacter yonseiensis]|uniref:DNA (cytosine-5-)-methyltransferase n=1 Tax=Luteolibacter yonseiensis TaxID=1144680 RepID=A0A934R184_9BACT|nr:DNA cytosine methyltransferase [Luteolibacter yonseiensis]MBK1816513.1 DNA cytosine methyltransferase [Luteolibacter yonseiensis]